MTAYELEIGSFYAFMVNRVTQGVMEGIVIRYVGKLVGEIVCSPNPTHNSKVGCTWRLYDSDRFRLLTEEEVAIFKMS